jgi:hypothetical protein
MTDHNIKNRNIIWKNNLEDELVDSSQITREALLKKWINPEKLEAQEDLKKIERKNKLENKIKLK